MPRIDCVQRNKRVIGRDLQRNLKRIFDEKKIHAWCDFWGSDVSHDWYWWFIQLRYFIPILLEDQG